MSSTSSSRLKLYADAGKGCSTELSPPRASMSPALLLTVIMLRRLWMRTTRMPRLGTAAMNAWFCHDASCIANACVSTAFALLSGGHHPVAAHECNSGKEGCARSTERDTVAVEPAALGVEVTARTANASHRHARHARPHEWERGSAVAVMAACMVVVPEGLHPCGKDGLGTARRRGRESRTEEQLMWQQNGSRLQWCTLRRVQYVISG